jgi:hypothetical protein
MANQKTAPVLLHIFNRPEMVFNLMKEIRIAKPQKLYISSDAGRPDHPEDFRLVEENRKIIRHIDWDCELKTLFQETNLGTRYAMYAAINWFFRHEPEGIVLEEDCLPNQSFFRFCSSLLAYYRNDPRIMHIAGTNQQFGKRIGNASYYFSAFPSIWGWAGWRRVWDLYDIEMKLFPEFEQQQILKNIFNDPVVVNQVYNNLRLTYENKNLTWDHQLGLTIVANNGLCVVPNVNLVSNIGVKKVGKKQLESVVSKIPTVEMEDTITHPPFFIPNRQADLNHITWTYEDTSTDKKTMYEKKQNISHFSTLLHAFKRKFLAR